MARWVATLRTTPCSGATTQKNYLFGRFAASDGSFDGMFESMATNNVILGCCAANNCLIGLDAENIDRFDGMFGSRGALSSASSAVTTVVCP